MMPNVSGERHLPKLNIKQTVIVGLSSMSIKPHMIVGNGIINSRHFPMEKLGKHVINKNLM